MTITVVDLGSKISAALGDLVADGNSVGNIASALETRGVKGFPGRSESCPLANYLQAEIPEAEHLCVTGGQVSGMVDTPDGRRLFRVTLRDPFNEFIKMFDAQFLSMRALVAPPAGSR